ncbi:MAG: SDR family NAD(P)-dependent oxidoreductase [Nanoarchaeota archaeon]|nr:SDR family NAD(P)-dependent oxidoreductase [Nanoarchaeota archaeon]
METVLVTGGAGFIGSHVCDRLLLEGQRVVCIDNLNDYYNPNIKKKNVKHNLRNKNFIFYKLDILNFKKLDKLFSKYNFDKVVHLAARAGVRASINNPFIYEETNVRGTLNLLELARKYDVKNFVFGSSSSVYGANKKTPFSESDEVNEQVSPYAVTKRAGELLCSNYHNLYNLNITCLRFFTVYGPRGRPDMAPLKFTHRIFNKLPIDMYGDGTSARDYTYISDIVDGIVFALNKNLSFEIINLGDSNPITLKDFISIIEKSVDRKAVIRKEPMPKGDVLITYADIRKAKRLLGYKPKIKISEGIRRLIEWYKDERN